MIITVLSVDGVNDPDILGLVATSAAIALSPIPWNGPIAGVRVGYVKDNGNSSFLINPTITEQGLSDFDFVVSGTREKTVMLEGGFCETPENVVFEAIGKAKEANAKIIDCITSLVKAVGSTKVPVSLVSQADELKIKISQDYKKEIKIIEETAKQLLEMKKLETKGHSRKELELLNKMSEHLTESKIIKPKQEIMKLIYPEPPAPKHQLEIEQGSYKEILRKELPVMRKLFKPNRYQQPAPLLKDLFKENKNLYKQLEKREKHWIAYGRAPGWPLENIAKGGNGWPAGSRHSDQTRAKIGDIVRLRLTDPKARAKLAGAWRGQKHSQEARAKIAKSVRQRFTDPTERDKHAEAQRGRMANPKEREKLAEAARQQWADPKVRATMVDAQRLRWLDPKEREKMVGINSGRTHTEEARARKRMSPLQGSGH